MTATIHPHTALSCLAYSYWKASLTVRDRLPEEGGGIPTISDMRDCQEFLIGSALKPHYPEAIRSRCQKEAEAHGWLRFSQDVQSPCDGGSVA
jgi:hypothetical protein